MDEDYNKPTFNNNQTETRRHVSLDTLNADGNLVAGSDDVESDGTDNYEELHRAISKLKPKQRDLIKKVFWEDIKQVELARAEGVSESAIAQRMGTIYKRLKKFLADEK
jgi:RNA polymerase sigma factor (sigma-70 family)